MERQNKLSIEMWDTASTIANTADTTSASTNSTAIININTFSNFAVTTTTASIVSVTTTTASIVSVTTSTASNFVAVTKAIVTPEHLRQGFIPGHGRFRHIGGYRGYSIREIERKMGGSSNKMLLSQVLQRWRKDVQKYYNTPQPGKRRRNNRGGQNSQGQRGRGGRGGPGGSGLTI